MRSSDERRAAQTRSHREKVARCALRVAPWVIAACLAIGCSPAPPETTTGSGVATGQQPAPSGGVSCSGDSGAVADVRRAVEAGPLFQVVSGGAGATACAATTDAESVTLEYRFRNGGSLRATRDPSIEYTELIARFASPPAQSPVDIMQRVERAAFSPDGCGIDWKGVEEQKPSDDPGATERVYRGDTCNCQSIVRADTTGRVVGLTFRSAC